MTDRAQFEAMLEALINSDEQAAKEIFHNIVVGKSREIYEELLAEDFSLEETDMPPAEPAPAATDAAMEEGDDEEGDESPFGGDDEEADDEEGDEEGEENPFGDEEEGGDDEGEGGDIEDRVMDLEDALDELKAEFEQLMADEEGEPEHNDGMDDPEFGMDAEPDMGDDELEMPMMEYVDKVALPKHGDNGVNTKSAVAGKNDMGGTTANIAKSFSTEKGGTQGGLANPSTKEENFGNVNVPGGNAGKTGFKKKEPGHGAEKKGSGDTAPDKKSLIGSRK
jgi:hypothetical protein